MIKANETKRRIGNLKCSKAVFGIGVALMMHSVAEGIPNLRIAVQGADVVLTWPSQTGAEYIVQFRPTLLPENPWATLANNHPASGGHSSQRSCTRGFSRVLRWHREADRVVEVRRLRLVACRA